MLIPCLKSEKSCSPCADGNPLANLSIEPFDLGVFPCVFFHSAVNVTPNVWEKSGCVGFSESPTSLTDACDRAAVIARSCPPLPPPFPPPPLPPLPPPAHNYTFCNEEATCQSGSNCYTPPACTVLGTSQADANAIAQSLCNSRILSGGSPCSVAPPEPPVEPPLDCPVESGAPLVTLEISLEQLWENHPLDDTSVIDYDLIGTCFSTALGIYIPTVPIDHPPGNYGLRYVSGLLHFNNPAYCSNPVFPFAASATVAFLQDAEHNYDTPAQCNNHFLANSFQPGGGTGVAGGCYTDIAAAVAAINTYMLGKTFTTDPYPPDAVTGFSHSNNGGDFSIMQFFYGPESDPDRSFPLGPVTYQIVQLTGLIPQPRKVAIVDYASLVSLFSDPDGAAGWNGEFTTRDEYTSMVLFWEKAAVGLFGGSKLSYITTHPTSANGKGWQLDIFSAGMILMWRGFKAVGNTSLGRYYRDSTTTPIGPACLTCADASDDQWFP